MERSSTTNTTHTTTPTTDDIVIYEHPARPDWGHAIMAWERGDRRGYQFEDGKLRVFKAAWYDRLHEVDAPLPKAIATEARLRHKLGRAPRAATARAKTDTISFDDQRRIFEHLYPDGFGGAAWRADKRGDGAARRLKRHRDPAIAGAREALDRVVLDRSIATGDHAAAWTAILGVLDATDLVISRHVARLRSVGASTRRDLVRRTRDLLWGDEPYRVRFERYVAALAMATGKHPSWQLATALSALVRPTEHVCIRPSVARAQAAWMAPRLTWSNEPDAASYLRLRDMMRVVVDELEAAGCRPTDLMDAHDFVWVTLRPAARTTLAELSREEETPQQMAQAA